ncbi:hypothetical protein L6164_001096 [Bauhinia variegata]|uniref:Uncharacterized protein n=1 Tax=Bauhinia variegata TaxID=167791 RepID=A0ACB9Q9V8_BAUVA|nr:hypothetical protein L6164_001096 [Bauhinia variegata]
MVAGAPQQQQLNPRSQQQQLQQQHQQQQQQSIPSAQDEALKRNTDCVYFLASPLTCKKGSECEYRHSEYARVNPRDCWYWLNGNCLNPKCSFRHPPLDSFLGTQATTPGGSAVAAPSQTATTTVAHPHNSSKQSVPCIFFQKGICLKGDRCAFLHGPNPIAGNKVPQVPVANQEAKTVPNVETASQRIVGVERHMALPPTQFDDEASSFRQTNARPVANGTFVRRSNRPNPGRMLDDPNIHNGKDNDEFLRESSPGFDVLVEDELTNSDYYHGEDQFGNARGQDGRNLDSVDEYNLGHSADYNSVADIDRQRFHAPQGYDSYDHMQEPYVWGQQRNSSERIFGASAYSEGRSHRKSDSPDNVEVSDLRHQLSKRRRVNGLKSVVSNDYYDLDSHGEEQSYQISSRKDSHQLPPNEISISSRFRGRIKLPVNGTDDYRERESDRTRNRSRLSPGRLRDRLRGKVHDDYERKNFRARPMRMEIMGDESADFAGPKSLTELKGGTSAENTEHQSLKKRKGLQDFHQPEDDLHFEDPKPLSEILKEKRAATAGTAAAADIKSNNKDREATNDSHNAVVLDTVNPTSGSHNTVVSETENGVLPKDESKFQVTDASGNDIDKTYAAQGQSEDGMIYDEGLEEQEYEGDDQRDGDGEYDYEQVDEGEYNYEEGENPEQEEYMDDEDGDDFAKKIGLLT